MKTIVITLTLLVAIAFFSTPVNAADVTLRWDPAAGATGYKIYSSSDNGVTWSTPVDVANVTQKNLTSQPDNVLILYKVSAYNATSETVAHWMGAWYDGRKKPLPNPTAAGIQ
jgi:hypothetical protein